MNDEKRRIARVEDELMSRERPMCLVGIEGDPESEEQYQAYLRSGNTRPFVWIALNQTGS